MRRRLIALTCAFPVLLGGLTGVLRPAVAGPVPVPAASPPLGDEYFTAAQLTEGLLAAADLPAGYTLADQGAGTTYELDVFGSNLCRGGLPDRIWTATTASQTVTNPDGGTFSVALAAVGPTRAGEIVGYVEGAPANCPSVTRDGAITTYETLALPDLGGAAAGMISVSRYGDQPAQRTYAVAVAVGAVSVVFQEPAGDGYSRARFLELVKAGAARVTKIGDPLTGAELKRGLITLADLPKGARQIANRPVNFFTEVDCDGARQRFDGSGNVARRSFATSGTTGDATVRVAIGAIGAGQAQALVAAVRKRRYDCPTVTGADGVPRSITDLPVPSTDVTVVGVVYPGDRPLGRAVIVYRDLCVEFQITMTEGADPAEIISAGLVKLLNLAA